MVGMAGTLCLTLCGLFGVLLNVQAQDYCGTTFLKLTDVHISHSYVKSSQGIKECHSVITSTQNSVVYLEIAGNSTLQPCANCSCRNLTAHDGADTDSKVLKTFCRPGDRAMSSGSFLTIVYRSNHHSHNSNFVVFVSSRQSKCDAGLSASENKKFLTLTNDPRGFTCSWYISADRDQRIRVRVLGAGFESCAANLKVYDDIPMVSNTLIGTVCGPTDEVFRSDNNRMVLTFHSTFEPEVRSWIKLEYTAFTPPPNVPEPKVSPHFQNTTIWICVGILSSICMIALAVCTAVVRMKGARSRAPADSIGSQNHPTMASMGPASLPSYDDVRTLPSYDEAMKTGSTDSLVYEEPPAYETLCVASLNVHTRSGIDLTRES